MGVRVRPKGLHDQEANVARQAEQNASSAAADKHKAAELARQQGALAFFTDTEGALKAYQRAAGYEPDDPDTLIFIGDLQDRLGQTQQALTTFDQARALLERKRAASPDNAALLSDLAVAHDRMGVEIQKQGNLESALAHFRQALAILQKLVQQDPGNQEWQRDLAVTHDSIGAVLQSAGKIADSLAEFRKAWRSSNRLLVTSPTMSISSSISHWRARASATAFSNKVT
ncbi:tetratricopeptide repeat protein [Paraburkholderia phytofirmans]|uniref:tetratricopeptide repeat protein n=1 Tax=Paraburkholderia sp. BL9I2N2 TaxID=1938809 RepID=UPI001052C3F4|nr:tetratricopeptide repeat protein [Paraburkholderia sp. BL9I2N2]TCK92167.1 tetratricopeptide repeat protein [Paraburkholderia sp. BL9I2N2]